jgi:hypothetical protein
MLGNLIRGVLNILNSIIYYLKNLQIHLETNILFVFDFLLIAH